MKVSCAHHRPDRRTRQLWKLNRFQHLLPLLVFEALTFEMITILKVVSFGIDDLLNSSENGDLFLLLLLKSSHGVQGAPR